MSDDGEEFFIMADEWETCRLQSREADRAELALLVDDYLARGGQITMLDPTATGLQDGYRTKSMVANASGNGRCMSERAKVREVALLDQCRRNMRSFAPLPIESLALKLNASPLRIRKLYQLFFADEPEAQALLATGKTKILKNHNALKEQRDAAR